MAKTSEVALNSQLAEVLRKKHPVWRNYLHVEQTGLFPENKRLQPDILISPPLSQPVVIETEYMPASSVEQDAIKRLGLQTSTSDHSTERVIALRLPLALRDSQIDLSERLAKGHYEYCIFSGNQLEHSRFPTAGWLTGSIDDVVQCIEFALVSERLVAESTDVFQRAIDRATNVISQTVELGFTDIEEKFASVLNQTKGTQTNRMAITIIANAMTFQESLAGKKGIPSIRELQDEKDDILQGGLLETWKMIREEINYWPILRVASRLLAPIRVQSADLALRPLATAASQLARIGITSRHDLVGRVFQKMIMDRKFLATFYTLPSSATLLSELAIARLDFRWRQLRNYPQLRIADLSCGTGTLLSAAYHSILRRYRNAGGNDARLHAKMIENAVIAADIMPAATHLCASQLSGVHPAVPFQNTQVYTMPYGNADENAPDRELAIGSLDLIESDRLASLFPTGQQQLRGSAREQEVAHIDLPHDSLDLIIMNPPFTRPTNHKKTDVPVPSFAGFRTTRSEQRGMSRRLSQIRKNLENPAGHGNAGLASNFLDLAHKKVKPGGTIALVLPIAVIQGRSWSSARKLLQNKYVDVVIVTIAKAGSRERAFSADTNMAEALIIATKKKDGTPDSKHATYVNLLRRPTDLIVSAEIAKHISLLQPEIKSGQLRLGEQVAGSFIRARLQDGGCAALRDTTIAETMMELRYSRLSMPRLKGTRKFPMTRLSKLGERGLLDRDIATWNPEEPPYRSPFQLRHIEGVAAYPALWGHEAAVERKLVVEPDSEGVVRSNSGEHAVTVWKTATRLHFTRDFGLNGQSLAACLTPTEVLGGRAWPSFKLQNQEWDELIVLWANSTLGLMSFWWSGSRQHDGRSILTISRLPNLLTIDPRILTSDQWQFAKTIFMDLQNEPLLPANEAYRDPIRQTIDKRLFIELLGFSEEFLEPLENLRLRWCAEPSVHGNKHTAPQTSV